MITARPVVRNEDDQPTLEDALQWMLQEILQDCRDARHRQRRREPVPIGADSGIKPPTYWWSNYDQPGRWDMSPRERADLERRERATRRGFEENPHILRGLKRQWIRSLDNGIR